MHSKHSHSPRASRLTALSSPTLSFSYLLLVNWATSQRAIRTAALTYIRELQLRSCVTLWTHSSAQGPRPSTVRQPQSSLLRLRCLLDHYQDYYNDSTPADDLVTRARPSTTTLLLLVLLLLLSTTFIASWDSTSASTTCIVSRINFLLTLSPTAIHTTQTLSPTRFNSLQNLKNKKLHLSF